MCVKKPICGHELNCIYSLENGGKLPVFDLDRALVNRKNFSYIKTKLLFSFILRYNKKLLFNLCLTFWTIEHVFLCVELVIQQ